ncbi:MAG: hypothetical protein ACTHMW_12820, partial [Actinomycetes bacterium]
MPARDAGAPAPDDLPRSKTGRIPQWVVDEALGRDAEATGFRTWTPAEVSVQRRRRRLLPALTALVIVGLVGFGVTRIGIGPLVTASAPARQGPPPG